MIDPYRLKKLRKPAKSYWIYFLFKKKKIIYIGQSRYLTIRLYQHARVSDWDSYSCIKCKKSEIYKIEARYIKKYKPRFNFIPKTSKFFSDNK